MTSSRKSEVCNFWSRVQCDLQPSWQPNSERFDSFEHVSSQTSVQYPEQVPLGKPNCLDNAHEKRVRRRRRGRGKYLIHPCARFSLMHQQLPRSHLEEVNGKMFQTRKLAQSGSTILILPIQQALLQIPRSQGVVRVRNPSLLLRPLGVIAQHLHDQSARKVPSWTKRTSLTKSRSGRR